MTDIGMAFLLVLLMLSQENEASEKDEFLDMLKHFMQPSLKSVEETLQEVENDNLFESEQLLLGMNQIQLIRQALDASDRKELEQALAESFDMLGVSLEEVKRDIQRLSAFCTQLNRSFKNIFDRTAVTITTIQAA